MFSKKAKNILKDLNKDECNNEYRRKCRKSAYNPSLSVVPKTPPTYEKGSMPIFIFSKQVQRYILALKLRCDEHFTHAFTACGCVFKEITLVGSNQGNYFENVTACSKRMLKTTVATQLNYETSFK